MSSICLRDYVYIYTDGFDLLFKSKQLGILPRVKESLDMAAIHLPYHIWVKDYHWTTNKIRVQSPVLNLQRTILPPVFRPKEGKNQNEPRIASELHDLSDNIRETEYLAEAHGVFIPNEPKHRPIPLWITYQQTSRVETYGETSFVDLRSSICRDASISRICWVPSHRSPDGKLLYTVLGGTRITQLGRKRIQTIVVCVQKEALPQEATFTWLSANDLSCLHPIGDVEKRRLFDMHHNIIRLNHNPLSEIRQIVFMIAKSPRSLDNGRRAFYSLLDQNPEPYYLYYLSDGSNGKDPLEIADWDGDDDSEQEAVCPVITSTPPAMRSDRCRTCKYPGLHPTRLNPFPEHYHVKDRDCPLGPKHPKHCIRAAHSPQICVIPEDEHHAHCNSLHHTDDPRLSFDTPLDSVEVGYEDMEVDSPLSYASYPSPPLSPLSPYDILDSDMCEPMRDDFDPLEEPQYELIMNFEISSNTSFPQLGGHIQRLVSPGMKELVP